MARLKPCPDEGRSLSSPACGRQVREDIGMARLTRRYKVGCSEPASESGRYMRVGHRGNHKGARDSPRPLHFKEKREADPSLRRPRTENVRRKKRPAAVRDDKFF